MSEVVGRCNKRTWDTNDEACEARDHINNKKSSIDRGLIMRVYKCSKCSLFHLTSMSKKAYKKRNRCRVDKEFRVNNRHESFIAVESAHWNKKFGIDDY